MQGIESITAVAGLQAETPAMEMLPAAPPPSASDVFANMLGNKVADINADVAAAETTLRDLAAGKSVAPPEAMITMERARISVLTFVQLRNRLVESYQDVMRMQL